MITLAARRRAGRFAQLVDGVDGVDGVDRVDDGELAPLLTLSRTLQRVPINGDIDPEFRNKLRARVVAMSAVRLPVPRETTEAEAPPAKVRMPGLRGPRRLLVAGGAVACVVSLAGVGVASRDAVVGDPLYGIKRATESTQLKLAGNDTDRGRRYLTVARTRMGETRQVRNDPAAVVNTLAAMDLATRQGSRLLTGVAANNQDRAPLDSIDKFVVVQRTDLGSLISSVPAGPARERAIESLVLIEQLRARSVALRATLVCPAAAASADDLGPRPVDCATAGPGSSTTPIPGLNGLPTPGDVTGTAQPGASPSPPGSVGAPAPPAGGGTSGGVAGAVGAVGGIVDDIIGGLGGGSSAPPASSPAPPPLGLPLPPLPTLPPLPLPSIIPTLPPLLG